MLPRQPLLPNNGAALNTLWSNFEYHPEIKSVEEPSIVTWAGPGRGVEGEHSTGVASAEEQWRSLNMRRQWGAK
jgi:hypothetical protein